MATNIDKDALTDSILQVLIKRLQMAIDLYIFKMGILVRNALIT